MDANHPPTEKKSGLAALLALCEPYLTKLSESQAVTPQVPALPSGPPNVKYPNGTMTEEQLSNVQKAYQKVKPPVVPPPTTAKWAPGYVAPPQKSAAAVLPLRAFLPEFLTTTKEANTAQAYATALTEFTNKVQAYLTPTIEKHANQYSSVLDGIVIPADSGVYCDASGFDDSGVYCNPIESVLGKTAFVSMPEVGSSGVPNPTPMAAAQQNMPAETDAVSASPAVLD